MNPSHRKQQIVSRLLGAFGLVLLVFVASQYLSIWLEGRVVERDLATYLAAGLGNGEEGRGTAVPAGETVVSPRLPAAPGSILGRLTIARLEIAVPLLEGVDDATLLRGAGRVPGTGLPGVAGNVVFAAHRDLHFAPLRYAERGDQIVLETPDGVRNYQVTSFEIAEPHDTAVLASTEDQLVLITCYPFRWVGRAPKRYIVRATPLDPPLLPRTGSTTQAVASL